MVKFLQNGKIEKVIEIILVLFGLFLIFQLIRKIFGGSWAVEDIIIGLLLFNTGAILTIGMIVAELKSDYKHIGNRVQKIEDQLQKRK